jgi:hypothetical protein
VDAGDVRGVVREQKGDRGGDLQRPGGDLRGAEMGAYGRGA